MLPINFHRTFIPERRLLAALLKFAANGKSGDYQMISVETGIPTGESSGKVPAILDYARGMGLITLASQAHAGVKTPLLTDFGRIVLLEDPLLGDPITQWIAHLNLCRKDIGAEAWYQVFSIGRSVLGSSFGLEQLEHYLVTIFGPGNNRTGPLIRTYQDDASLARGGILEFVNGIVSRKKAPVLDVYAIPYTAYILTILDSFFVGHAQVSITDLAEKTGLFDGCLWNETDIDRALNQMQYTGFIGVDRQTRTFIIERKATASEVWPLMYSEIA